MMFGAWLNIHRIFKRQAQALTRLRVFAGWSEPLLVTHSTSSRSLISLSFCSFSGPTDEVEKILSENLPFVRNISSVS